MDPIQGDVSHSERHGGDFWQKVGDILGNISEAVLDAAVPIGAAVASSLVRPVAGGGFNNVGCDDYGQWESDPYPSQAQLDAQFQQEEANRRRRWGNVINQPLAPVLASQYVLERPSQPLPKLNQPLPQTNL